MCWGGGYKRNALLLSSSTCNKQRCLGHKWGPTAVLSQEQETAQSLRHSLPPWLLFSAINSARNALPMPPLLCRTPLTRPLYAPEGLWHSPQARLSWAPLATLHFSSTGQSPQLLVTALSFPEWWALLRLCLPGPSLLPHTWENADKRSGS